METKEIIANITAYCEEHGFSRAEFERICGLSNGMVGSWSKGTYAPSLKAIEKIANKTHIPAPTWLTKGAFDGNAKEQN